MFESDGKRFSGNVESFGENVAPGDYAYVFERFEARSCQIENPPFSDSSEIDTGIRLESFGRLLGFERFAFDHVAPF